MQTICRNPSDCSLCGYWTLTVFQVHGHVKTTLLIQQSKSIRSLIETGEKWWDDTAKIYYQIRPE